MWLVQSLTVSPRFFRFEALPPHADTALLADGVEVVNMLGRVEWSHDPAQWTLCDCCGYPGCNSGAYVSPRRLGDFVVTAPAVSGYTSADAWERGEKRAPGWMSKRGGALIPAAEWDRAREVAGALPSAASLAPLSWVEAFLLAQFDAPRLLGRPGQHRQTPLSSEILATDPWIAPDALDALASLTGWADRPGAPQLRRDGFTPVTLFLEAPLVSGVVFVRAGESFGLMLAPGMAIV